ncbi:MAG TPA: accessory factor UbiK family protein [Thermodesulfobacteriota bacterium]|nr:accessory factor UbiK family protein [Thermodesulfobacteriota bacterium]
MADILDKAILIGMGLEKKVKELLDELQEKGTEERKAGAPKEGEAPEELTPKQAVENKVVDEGVRVLREFLSVIRSTREKLEKECSTGSERILDKLHVASQEDIDVIKEMARIAREKVDTLEKRIEELEKKAGKGQ